MLTRCNETLTLAQQNAATLTSPCPFPQRANPSRLRNTTGGTCSNPPPPQYPGATELPSLSSSRRGGATISNQKIKRNKRGARGQIRWGRSNLGGAQLGLIRRGASSGSGRGSGKGEREGSGSSHLWRGRGCCVVRAGCGGREEDDGRRGAGMGATRHAAAASTPLALNHVLASSFVGSSASVSRPQL
jgi:hypothetical protein